MFHATTEISMGRLMRWIAIGLVPVAFASCSHTADATGAHGQIRALVQNEFQQPVGGKLIEVRELALTKYTGKDGLATFTVPPGDYVVRAYDLGGPGPALLYVDQDATVKAGETTDVAYLDCQSCVGPAGAAPD